MIIITGATGALNGATVDHLLDRVPARDVAVTVRDVAKAGRFAERGVDVRHGDYADPGSLPDGLRRRRPAAAGLLERPRRRHGGPAPHRDRRGRRRRGRTHPLHEPPGRRADSPFAPARVHAATEQLLAESGVAWTSLRNGFYAHSLHWLAGPWRETGVVRVPADGPVSWTAREDAAEAAAVILASDGAYDGPITLTAPAAPTFADIAAIASELTGDTVGSRSWSPTRGSRTRSPRACPSSWRASASGMYQAAQQGGFAGVDPLLGDPPRPRAAQRARPAGGPRRRVTEEG